MTFAIKAEIAEPAAKTLVFERQKTMYGGKKIARGDIIFLFASENEGGRGLIAQAIVISAEPVAKDPKGPPRQTPCVSITVQCTASTKQNLGRSQLKKFANWNDARPETELNFKFYRQATNKIVSLSDTAARFLRGFF